MNQVISVGQALLILIDQHKEDQITLQQLKLLYFSGIQCESDRIQIEEWLQEEALRGYTISIDYKIIDNDPSRRYFETHLAYHTLQTSLKNLNLEEVESHYSSFQNLIADSPITKKIFDDLIHSRVDELEKNTNLCPSDKNIIKEYSDLLSKLNISYAISKLKSENEMQKKSITEKDLEKSINEFKMGSPYKQFSAEDRRKMELLALVSLTCSLISKDIVSLPIDIYNEGYYIAKNRGRIEKQDQAEVKSNHLGLMRNYMPVPRNDIAYSETTLANQRVADRYTFNPEAKWVKEVFSRLVHPFSCSISGIMLGHHRAFKFLKDSNQLIIDSEQKYVNYLKTLISFLLYNSGGHTFYEFTFPLSLPEIKEAFSFINNFDKINKEQLFFYGNEEAFEKSLEETIFYNKIILNKARVHQSLLTSKPTFFNAADLLSPTHEENHSVTLVKK